MDLSVSQMMQLQRELYGLHRDQWVAREPEFGRDHILYMIEEVGEVISILKKKGNGAVMTDPAVRSAFLEEMSDILMYYTDVLLCYQVSAQELSEAYAKKSARNMGRDYAAEYKELFKNG